MKLALVSPSMGFGGAERLVAMLVGGLAARGHEVALLAPRGELDADLRGVEHERIEVQDHGRGARGAVTTALALARALRRLGPDLVHAQNVKSTALVRGALLPGRRPRLLSTFHGVEPGEYRRAALLLRAADGVACVSEDLLEGIVAAGLPRARAELIGNAVPLADELPAAERQRLDRELALGPGPVVTIAGRLVPQKAHERFVVAARRIADEVPGAKLLIVGDGPRRAEIEALVDAAGLGERVAMTGGRSDAREIIARSDVLVFSSDWEGLSIAALEALAAGTPIVATDVHGMRELLADGAGAVVALDDGTALGERVVALLEDAPERAAMGAAGRALVGQRYSLERMLDAYEAAYGRLLGR
jgi:glycosyltransferase involved in cell wall biosynthesis